MATNTEQKQKDRYLLTLFNRAYLNHHPKPNPTYLEKYMIPRYQTGKLLRDPNDFTPLKEQLENFIIRQIKLEENQKYLTLVPEFMKYLYAIMPDRKSMMITVDELSELVENSEIEVAKQLRGQ